jgi:hypothetical protein
MAGKQIKKSKKSKSPAKKRKKSGSISISPTRVQEAKNQVIFSDQSAGRSSAEEHVNANKKTNLSEKANVSSHSRCSSKCRKHGKNARGLNVENKSNIASLGRHEMSVQTDIRGVEHRILIRPEKFDSDPFAKNEELRLSAERNLEKLNQDDTLSAD